MADHTFTLALVLPALELDAAFSYNGPRSTDTSNSMDGRERGGGAIVTRTPPVVVGSYPLPEVVDKAQAFPAPDLDDQGRPVPAASPSFTSPKVLARPSHIDRITMAGVDITWWGADLDNPSHAPLAMPGFALIEPGGYGASEMLTISRTNSLFQQYGTGALHWLHQGARVQYQRVYDIGTEDERVVVDYRGEVLAVLTDEVEFRVNIGGEITGRSTLKSKPPVKVRKLYDLGTLMYFACRTFGVHLVPAGGPDTGLTAPNEGGLDWDSWMNKVGALSQTHDSARRALMPSGTWGGSRYSFEPKDTTTKHVTVFVDGAKGALRVVDDVSEQPTTVYGNGTDPNGERWDGAKYPGVVQGPPAPYPVAGSAPFGIGTTDADTLTGVGITVLRHKLAHDGLLADSASSGSTYDTQVANAVKALQEAAGLTVNGTMTTDAWAALWNSDVVGYSLEGAQVFPLAQAEWISPWKYSVGGEVIARNPKHIPGAVDTAIYIDYGVCEEAAARAHARSLIKRSYGHQWAGTLTLDRFHAWSGEVADGDIGGLTADDMMSNRDIRPGMNVWLPHFEGGTLFHVAQARVTPGDGGDTVELMIDTGFRDVFDLSQALKRNRESRRSPFREFVASNQGYKPPGNLIARDKYFGKLYQDVRIAGGRWNVFPFILGQSGTVGRTDVLLQNVATEYCVVVFARKPSAARLQRLIGNPFQVDGNGQTAWEHDSTQFLQNNRVLMYLAGQGAQPAGYGWKIGYTSDGTRTANPLTGRHLDDSSWSYYLPPETAPLGWMAVFPRRSADVKRGRLFYALEDDVT